MRVRVRFFAGTRDAVGAAHTILELPGEARVSDVWAQLVAQHPGLARYAGHALVAVDGAFVPHTAAVREGAEVAVMPPVSGGAVQEAPFSLDAIVATLRTEGAGAVVAFTGLVRETSGEQPGARVTRLEFEAYAEMAEREIARLRDAAIAKFGLVDCAIVHRVGALHVGDPIVAVVTSAAHRRAAFEAAAWLMDELKTSVPIWKREVAADGGTWWVNDVEG